MSSPNNPFEGKSEVHLELVTDWRTVEDDEALLFVAEPGNIKMHDWCVRVVRFLEPFNVVLNDLAGKEQNWFRVKPDGSGGMGCTYYRIKKQSGPAHTDVRAQHGLKNFDGFRKFAPIFEGFVAYFPDAIAAVAELSRVANEQHNPGEPIHWDKSKSQDELNALMSHVTRRSTGEVYDTDMVRHATKIAWRACAALQREIDAEKMAEGSGGTCGTGNGSAT